MNEELQKQLVSILEAATATASSAKDFVLAELPDVAKQLLLWELWQAVVYLTVLGVLPIVALVFLWRWANKYRKKEDTSTENKEACAGVTFGVTIVIAVVSSIALVTNILTIVKVLVAPKLFLLEYASKLIN